jgi:hypothetical protein
VLQYCIDVVYAFVIILIVVVPKPGKHHPEIFLTRFINDRSYDEAIIDKANEPAIFVRLNNVISSIKMSYRQALKNFIEIGVPGMPIRFKMNVLS